MFLTTRHTILLVLLGALVLTAVNIVKDIQEHTEEKIEDSILNVSKIQ
jgi:predicted small secreted protein